MWSLLYRHQKTKFYAFGVVDAFFCFISFWVAISLRLESWVWWKPVYWVPTLCSVLLLWGVFGYFKVYKEIVSHLGMASVLKIVSALGVYTVIYVSIFTVISVDDIPRSIGLMQPIILLAFVAGVRLIAQYILRPAIRSDDDHVVARILIYGAGVAGRQLCVALQMNGHYDVLGFMDDNPRLTGGRINGVPIYSPQRFSELRDRFEINEVILAIPSLNHNRRIEIVNYFASYFVHVRALPELFDLKNLEQVNLEDLRELDLGDILGRSFVEPSSLLMDINISNKTIMVTGAGGSIGSELCRQAILRKPKKLLLVDVNEYSLYKIHAELLKFLPRAGFITELVPLLANIQNKSRIDSLMRRWKPNTVYHAAAYKHVPLVEENLSEGISNNVFGTYICAHSALQHGVDNFILISTDKAVRPTNVMGASKHIAELILKSLAHKNTGPTKFSMVRFGNVLDSSGSVVPLFRDQIKHGGPVTVTHKEVTRFFMTIPEAAQLVIQAGAMTAKGGEVFILDMGSPVKVYDLAKRMIELSGKRPVMEGAKSNEIQIQIIGLRPGEKLYEELLLEGSPGKTQHPLIMVSNEAVDFGGANLDSELNKLKQALTASDLDGIFELLAKLVPGYSAHAEVVDKFFIAESERTN